MTGRMKAAVLAAGVGMMAVAGAIAGPAVAQEAAAASTTAKPPKNAPYRNPALPTEQRVADLLARMTLEEKVAQLLSLWGNKGEVAGWRTASARSPALPTRSAPPARAWSSAAAWPRAWPM